MFAIRLILAILPIIMLAGCSSSYVITADSPTLSTATATVQGPDQISSVSVLSPTPVASPTSIVAALPTDSPTTEAAVTPTTLPTLSPEEWKTLPVIPNISDTVIEIYERGLALGNNPQAFSKIGDCGSTPAWFLGDFDRDQSYYRLGDHTYLVPVIEEFKGSYGRTSLAAKSGFNASSIFAPIWTNRDHCQPDEFPLACEYRVNRPILAFIMLGSNDVWHLDTFESQMRRLIEYSIDNGVIPILSTKADNLEKDHIINLTIARLAEEYQIPLLNYWRAVQELPDQGLQEDGVHITWGPNRFDDPQVMKAGWPIRNLTTLQMLDAVWQAIEKQPRAQQ